MSVTLMRRQVIELGEKTIKLAKEDRPKVIDSTPEVIAFRQVLELGTAFARGNMSCGGVDCPMRQTVFSDDAGKLSPLAFRLALCWDQATRSVIGSGSYVIEVNPYT